MNPARRVAWWVAVGVVAGVAGYWLWQVWPPLGVAGTLGLAVAGGLLLPGHDAAVTAAPRPREDAGMTNEVWVVLRQPGDGPATPVAVYPVGAAATAAAAELGEGHVALPCPMVSPADEVRVVSTWSCRASVVDGAVTVHEPVRLAGASELVIGPAPEPIERVAVDQDAGELEAAVHGRAVTHLTAFASTGERARKLATAEAERVARGANPS